MTAAPLVLVPSPAIRPWLSRTLLRGLREATINAPRQGIVALQTAPEAALSYPLLAYLKAAGIPWVTASPGGGMENALTAADEGRAPSTQAATRIYGSVLHAATEELVIGSFTASMLLASSGSAPTHMGSTEPLENPWDSVAVTAWLRQHMPLGTLLLSGPHFAGAITAHRTDAGVIESFDVLLSAEPSANPGPPGVLLSNAARRAEVEGAAIEANVQEFGVDLHFGVDGLAVPAGRDAFRVPQMMVLGPALQRRIHPEHLSVPEVNSKVIGTAPFQHLAIRYPESAVWDGGRTRDLQQRMLSELARTEGL
ncbi:DUF6177 family protein [Arthrobacter sp. NPDC056727]|uniref:DUF6177 family protein n=1 Tax=Arthrobacter sp. NPDC056727 TaxID=3345927 RepID=UPI00366AF8D6